MTHSATPNQFPVDRRVERILGAALHEFSARGFGAARTRVIARKAGVSSATLRQLFPSKEELFREVVRTTIVDALQVDEPGAGAGPASASAVWRLREFARRFWRTMAQPEHSALLRLSVSELHRFPELALFHSVEVWGRAARQLESTLLDGAERGELRIADPRAAARVVLAALITHAHWFSFPQAYSPITGSDRAGAEAAVIEVLVNAISY